MVKGESKSPKRSNNKLDGSSASSTSTRNSRQKLSESFPEVGRRIKVYKNGEPYDQGITFVLNMRKTHDIGTFLDLVTSRIGLVQGAKKLYTLDGKLVKKTDELVNGKEYVASSGSFIPLPYGKKKAERESSSTSIRSISRLRASSTGPAIRSKSIEIKKKMPTMNGTSGNGNVGNGGGTFGRSKSQVSLKGKTNSIPNGHAKIVTPVTPKRTLVKKSSLPSGTQTTTKKVTNVIAREGKAANPGAKTKTTATATKIEKKVEKTKKLGKKKIKEVIKEEGAVIAGGTVAAAGTIIAASEIIKHKSPTPSPSPPPPPPPPPPPKTPVKSPSPKDSPRPMTAASKKDESEEDEKEESDRESIVHHHEEEADNNESSEGHSETASETDEEEEVDHIERTESEGSGRPGTAVSKASRRGSLKSNKSIKSQH